MGAPAHRGDLLQRWVAACFAVLLAIAPLARPSLPIELTAAPVASPAELVAGDHAQGKQPITGLVPAQPSNLGILSRPASLETMLGLVPAKPPLLRPVADQAALAPLATAARGGELQSVFQRSSIGTARTPTGPPS